MLKTSLRISIAAIAATVVAIATSACSSGSSDSNGDGGAGGLPDFNSIDTSVTCPAGQIGWNYSTGGGTLDTSQGTALAGVQILTASYGSNCNANLANNEVPLAVTQCNGQTVCDFTVGLTYDPAVNCAKEFDTTWQCGSDSTIYSGSVTKEAGGKVFAYDCGAKINVRSAQTVVSCGTLGGPQAPVNAGSAVSQACNNRASCTYNVPDYQGLQVCSQTLNATWTCGSNPHVYSQTDNINLSSQYNQYTTPFSISCPGTPAINVQQATWGGNCNVAAGNLTTQVGNACNGNTTGTCPYTVGGIPDPHYGCAKNFEVKYTCGDNPYVYDSVYPPEAGGKTISLSCSGSTPFTAGNTTVSTGQKACIATSCPYNQPRDPGTEQCGPVDNTRQKINSVSLHSYTFSNNVNGQLLNPSVYNAGPTTISSNSPANMTAELDISGPNVEATLEPWMTYLFFGKSGQSAEGFLCALTPIDVQSYSYFTHYTVSSGSKVLPAGCFDARSNPWADAAARLGITEAQFRNQYTYGAALMHFSYDTEGKVGLASYPLPNPPGFFYKAATNYTDFISFYQQRELTTVAYGPNDAPWPTLKWNPNPPTEYAQAYNLQTSTALEVNLDGVDTRKGGAMDINYFSPVGPQLAEDIHWSLVGDSPVNPLSPTTTNPQGSVKNLQQANLRATVEMYPAGQSPNSTVVVGSIPLAGGVPTGGTTSGTLTLPPSAVSQIFGAWSQYNTFSLKTCIDLDGVNTRSGSTIQIPDTSIYSGKINGECNLQTSVIIVNRTFIKYVVATQQTANGVSNGDNSSKGDSSNSSSDGSGSEKSCVKGTSSAGKPTVTCSAAQASNATGGGAFANSFYSVTANSSETHTSNAAAGTPTEQGASSGTGEILGFQVLDQDDGPQNGWQSQTGSAVNTVQEVFISPNWDAIADAFNDTPAQPKPQADEGLYGGHLGLGFGIGYKQFLGGFGVIDINFAIGVSIGLDFKWTNAPPEAYPCIGPKGGNKCFQVTANYYTQPDAAKQCEVEGGQLANLISANDYAAAVQTLASWPPQYNIWTGGQENYEYAGTNCANLTNPPASCVSHVHYDWSDPSVTEFGLANGTSNSATLTASHIGTNNITLTNFAPTPAGVVINHAGNIHDQVQSQLNYALCQFDAAPSTTYSEYDASVPIGAGAGLTLQYCWPSDEVGVCLLGTLQFIGIALNPTLSTYQTTLYDSTGTAFGFRSDTNVGIPWNVTLLSGEIDLIAQFLFWSTSYKLYQYPGFILAQGNLASYDWPSQENF